MGADGRRFSVWEGEKSAPAAGASSRQEEQAPADGWVSVYEYFTNSFFYFKSPIKLQGLEGHDFKWTTKPLVFSLPT